MRLYNAQSCTPVFSGRSMKESSCEVRRSRSALESQAKSVHDSKYGLFLSITDETDNTSGCSVSREEKLPGIKTEVVEKQEKEEKIDFDEFSTFSMFSGTWNFPTIHRTQEQFTSSIEEPNKEEFPPIWEACDLSFDPFDVDPRKTENRQQEEPYFPTEFLNTKQSELPKELEIQLVKRFEEHNAFKLDKEAKIEYSEHRISGRNDGGTSYNRDTERTPLTKSTDSKRPTLGSSLFGVPIKKAILGELLEKRKRVSQDSSPEAIPIAEPNKGSNIGPLVDTPPLANSMEKELPEKYKKMLKVGLPMSVVRNAMQRDGVSVDNFPEGGEHKDTVKPPVIPEGPKDPFRRFRVHWNSHGNVRNNTVWAMVERDQPWMGQISLDEDELKALFQAPKQIPNEIGMKIRNSNGAETCAQSISPKRANNGGIVLARIKMTNGEIAAAVDDFDHNPFTLSQLQGMHEYLPTPEEAKALKSATGREKTKTEAEKYMITMMGVGNVKDKLEAMIFMKQFPVIVQEILEDARLLRKVCEEISCSTRLRKILGLILHIGNVLNTIGTNAKEPAVAFHLSSLRSLSQAKAFDKRTSFLEYVARVTRRNEPHLLHFTDDLASLSRATKLDWESTQNEVENLENRISFLRTFAMSSAGMKDQQNAHQSELNELRKTSLGCFTIESCLKMTHLYSEIEASQNAFDAVVDYFGETEVKKPAEMFEQIANFATDFETATQKAVTHEKERLRNDSKRDKKVVSQSRKYVRVSPRETAKTEKKGIGRVFVNFRNR